MIMTVYVGSGRQIVETEGPPSVGVETGPMLARSAPRRVPSPLDAGGCSRAGVRAGVRP
jgi:hypothetical protein